MPYETASVSDSDVALSGDEIASNASTDSGHSDNNVPLAEKAAVHRGQAGAETPTQSAAKAAAAASVSSVCTMCDVEPSLYICDQCGHLTFCLKCCISLHDNKFLGAHKLVSMGSTHAMTVQQLKGLAQQQQQPHVAAPVPATQQRRREDRSPNEKSPVKVEERPGVDLGPPPEEPLDLVALSADRNVILHRLKEIENCVALIRKHNHSLAEEREATRTVTQTAILAVRKKFDVVRNLLNAKEAEFIEVVETAGTQRLDLATRSVSDAAAMVSESTAYVEYQGAQMERLHINKRLFNDTRKALLESTEERLNQVADASHRLQSRIDEIRSYSLGVRVPVDNVVECLQALAPVSTSVPPRVHSSISAEKFNTSPGTKVWSNVPPNENSVVFSVPRDEPPVSLAKQMESLKGTPVPRQSSPARRPPASSPTVAQTTGRGSPSRVFRTSSPVASRTNQNNVSVGSTPGNAKASSELNTLRQHISSLRSGSGPAAAPTSTTPRRASPARASPMRSDSTGTGTMGNRSARNSPVTSRPTSSFPAKAKQSPTDTGNTRVFTTPGPGSYQPSPAFGKRTMLSTPPRSRPGR